MARRISVDQATVESPRVLTIQHNKGNGIGRIEDMPLEMDIHRSDKNPVLPSLDGYSGLIVMGGPQAAFSDVGFASRKAELSLIRGAVAAGLPVLGVCLGSQLLAVAMGGRGFKMDKPENGYAPVTLTQAAANDELLAGAPIVFSPLHKHQHSYEMPPGAVRLASSDQCLEQGFRLGKSAWGLQFHFEMLPTIYGKPRVEEERVAIAQLAPTATKILSNFCSIVQSHASINAQVNL